MIRDEFDETAYWMEREAKRQLKLEQGHFKDAYWTAIQHIAVAYMRADKVHAEGMRVEFRRTFEHFNNQRQGITTNV